MMAERRGRRRRGPWSSRYEKGRSRDLPLTVAQLPIFSKAYYAGRPFEESTLEAPLGSGAYKVSRFEQGRFIEFARVPDYWARDLPVNAGQNNFDRLRYEYYRDRQVALEGFKAGVVTFREEFTSRDWATAYDFPAVREGRVKRDTIPDETPSGTQGWFFNIAPRPVSGQARPRGAGAAVRFRVDERRTSCSARTSAPRPIFENSDMKAKGKPSPEEVALLEPFTRQSA